jgi:hypothetical protein
VRNAGEHIIIVRDSNQHVSLDRKFLQLYVSRGFLANNRIRSTIWIIRVTEINIRETKRCGLMDNLHRRTFHQTKGRSQDFMAVD